MASDSVKIQPEHLLKHLTESNLKFTEDLYKILSSEDGDLFFSPISLQIPLLLLFSGASGQVAEEMKTGLNLSKSKEEVLMGLRMLLDQLKNPNLKIASQIFVEKTYVIKKTFTDLIKPYLESPLEPVDFKKSPDEATRVINSWVSEKTEKKISEIIPADSLNALTRLIMVNVVHFREIWYSPFNRTSTRDEPFHTTKNSVVNVPTMHLLNYFYYSEEKSYEALKLPFRNRDFSFLILLPKEIEGLRELENKLSASEFRKIFDNLKYRPATLTLPKFKMEKTIDDMADVLKKLGMETMFNALTNDFSEIHDGEENLFVSDVLHKTMLDVNEDGCEAIAVTVPRLIGGGYGLPDGHVYFKVDHPFIFLILHRDVILFMGRKNFNQ